MAKKIKSACKKTGKKLIKFWSAILSFLLGFMGIQSLISCLYGIVEYGMPYAEFTVSGKVRSISTEDSIPGIRVSAIGEIEMMDYAEHYTDVNGEYSITFITIGAVDTDVTMSFEDIDGTVNGSYNDKDVVVTITEEDFIDDTPDNDWDDGSGSRTLNVDLDPST